MDSLYVRCNYLLARSPVLSGCADAASGTRMTWRVRNMPGELETCLLLPAGKLLNLSKLWLLYLLNGNRMVHRVLLKCRVTGEGKPISPWRTFRV